MIQLIGEFLPWVAGIVALVGAWFVNNKVQQRKGRKAERQKAKELDHENANEIRARVSRDRDQLVRDRADTGWRDS